MPEEIDIASSDASELAGRLGEMQTRTKALTGEANAFARAMSGAFTQGIASGKGFDQILRSLALRISSLALNLALRPVTNAIGSGISNLFGGLTSAAAGGGSMGSAAGQLPVPFARGGVIASPSYFPLGDGRTGLAGEAGAEAIMPLTRGRDGRLGVAASGGGSSNVTINIATPDAESFRRSETYLTGLIARAVARGQRGL